jgi:acetyl esterase/lipase
MSDRKDVPYCVANGRELLLDVYEPRVEPSQRTAVLLVHGGGWRAGDRTQLADHAQLLAAEGFTALVCEYRLLGESPFPAALDDVKAAVRWARANAQDLGIDTDRIVLQGHSAGGHLSLLAAETAADGEQVAAVVAFYPPTLFHVGVATSPSSMAAGGPLGDGADAEAARAASPLTHVSADHPPTFFVTGGADQLVPPSASVLMYDALRAIGVEADLHIVGGQGHAFDRADALRPVLIAEVALFVKRTVSERVKIAEQTAAVNAYMAQVLSEIP